MNRRQFMAAGAGAAVTASWAPTHNLFAKETIPAGGVNPLTGKEAGARNAVNRHRLGVNYSPSNNWWFCWNDWNADPIRRDLDAIAALGADHLRIMLIWPFFQPNYLHLWEKEGWTPWSPCSPDS
jgi:hypothetical protein